MSAFPKPEPDPPRVVQLRTSPEDQQLAKIVLAVGNHDISRIAMMAACEPEHVIARMKDPAFKALLDQYIEQPEKLIPSRAQLFAKLSMEADRGDRSTDRQRAIELLLEIDGQRKPQDKITKYKKNK